MESYDFVILTDDVFIKLPPIGDRNTHVKKTVSACDTLPAYARVNIIRDNADELALIEMELIEPELWFRLHPKGVEVLAYHLSKQS